MKRIITHAALVTSIVFCTNQSSIAQFSHPVYEWGVNAGFLVYQGDLAPGRLGSFKTQQLSWGVQASKLLNTQFSLRGSLVISKFAGDESKYEVPEYHQFRNFSFTSPVTEVTAHIVWNVAGDNYAVNGLLTYLFAGAGFSLIHIKRDWSHLDRSYFNAETTAIWAGLAADSVHSLPRFLPVIPVGGGLKYFFTPNWAVNLETTYRIATTDYLDGFSQGANPGRKDNYLGYSIGIIYRKGIKNRLGCPVLKQ